MNHNKKNVRRNRYRTASAILCVSLCGTGATAQTLTYENVYAEEVQNTENPEPEAASTETANTEAAPVETESTEAPAQTVEVRELHIKTAEDLKQLVKDCRMDAYSMGLHVILDADIDLKDEPLIPIPTFSGTFNGNGHTIRGFVCASNGSNQGLFRYLQTTAVVENLNLIGTVTPGGSGYNIGGLAGTNYGKISTCTFTGEVKAIVNVGGICGMNYGTIVACGSYGRVLGKQYTGGICGFNDGSIGGCTNNAIVNDEIVEAELDTESLKLIDLVDIASISAKDAGVVMDTGGIVGGSKGVVTTSTNKGAIGYQHYGYNVGGIAGRQSGFLDGCENYGTVLGRKDIAGICGQMEPYLFLEETEDLVKALQDLNTSIDNAMGALAGDASAMSGQFSHLANQASAAWSGAQSYSSMVEELYQEFLQQAGLEQSPTTGEVLEKIDEVVETVDDVYQGVDDSTVDDILSGDVTDDTITDVGDSLIENGGEIGGAIGEAIEGVQEDVQNTDPGVIEDIASGQVSHEDTDKVVESVENSYAVQAAHEAIARQQAEEAAESNKFSALENQIGGIQADLASKINVIGGALSSLNDSLSGLTADLAANMAEVNQRFAAVNNLMTRIMTGDMTYYQDVSELDTDENLDGKVSKSTNYGMVEGDQNIGGIAGQMGIEVEFDVEGLIESGKLVSTLEANLYQTRCVIRDCTNLASIEGRKSCVGGVAGEAKTGVIFFCKNYGDISTDTEYAGGIVGETETLVKGSYSMCTLSGNEFVGGIAGKAVQITDCVSIVSLTNEQNACIGAIAGYLDITKENAAVNNFYVSDTLGAIDGISYAGKGEPISFKELSESDKIHEDYKSLVVTFEADDVIIDSIMVEYGDSIDPDAIPAVPEKEGYSGEWEEVDLTNIEANCVVNAVYEANQKSVASDETRTDGGLPVIVAEGEFDGLTEIEVSVDDSTTATEKYGQIGEVQEIVNINVHTAEPQESYRLRYLVPDKEADYRLFAENAEGEAEELNVEKRGSYLVFETKDPEAKLILVKAEKSQWPLIGGGAAAFVLVVLIALSKLLKKKK